MIRIFVIGKAQEYTYGALGPSLANASRPAISLSEAIAFASTFDKR